MQQNPPLSTSALTGQDVIWQVNVDEILRDGTFTVAEIINGIQSNIFIGDRPYFYTVRKKIDFINEIANGFNVEE